MSVIFTQGDRDNCKCPHCGKNNVYVCQGQQIPFERKYFEFAVQCHYCGKTIYYKAHWKIFVQAEKQPL